MKTNGLFVVGALALGSIGCNGLAVDPIDSNPPPGEGETGSPSAIAMPMSKWQASPGSNPEIAPFAFERTSGDDLVIFLASKAQSCDDPILVPSPAPGEDNADCSVDPFWQIALVLPQDMAQPGVIDLETDLDDAIRAHWSAQWHDCSGGWAIANAMPGTLEISSVDASSISMELSAELPIYSSSGPTPDPSGQYTATFCP